MVVKVTLLFFWVMVPDRYQDFRERSCLYLLLSWWCWEVENLCKVRRKAGMGQSELRVRMRCSAPI
jgi:hypothetical protein